MKITALIPVGPASKKEQLQAVKDYAAINYEKGWDEVVEAWDDSDIMAQIKKCNTRWGAIESMREIVKLRNGYAAEVRASAF